MTTLIVVESPSKAAKIQKIVGRGYLVYASGGHIRDLPTKPGVNGFDAKTFEPEYEVTERSARTVGLLKSKYASCTKVLLGTDPDREGEAIGWHVAEVLGIPDEDRLRVKFHEITSRAILAAIANPEPLDSNLVRAQEARRVYDRMVGWMVSWPLGKFIGERASAGRVQSPSMGLVVQRERDIKNFVKSQFFNVTLSFNGWVADWATGKDKCLNKADAVRAAAVRELTVKSYVERDEFEAPPGGFDTAVMQQAASVKLGFDPDKTMQLAQKLFEGYGQGGLITYHRTDDTNLSDEAFAMIRDYAKQHNLPVVKQKRRFKSAAGAQEAHEAIRPTNFNADTSLIPPDERALYELILQRAVASQLTDVVHSVRRAKLDGGMHVPFDAVGRVLKDKGWRGYTSAAEVEHAEPDERENNVPVLEVGAAVRATQGQVRESSTRPPIRYTKAELVKTLKALGIGRPATYAAAVDGLEKKAYVKMAGRQLAPTPLAFKIFDALTDRFRFIDVGFTKRLEDDLDEIAAGRQTYTGMVSARHAELRAELAAFNGAAAPTPSM